MSMIPVVENEGIPFMCYGGSVDIAEPTKKWVFQMPTTDRVAMRDILRYLKKRNLTRIAMLHSTGGWGKSGMERLKEQAPGAGFTILGYESFGDKDVDMTSQLVRIRDLNPQAIITWTATTAGAIISKNIKQLGIKSLHVHDHGFGNIKYVKVGGDAVNGDVVPLGRVLIAEELDSTDPQKKMMLDFRQRYESKWNEAITNFAAYSTDGLMVIKKALEAVGPDRKKIRDYIENLKNFIGYYRIYSYGPDDHGSRETSALVMVEVVNQNWKLIKD
jgi:branched-chain amino acid transport system substrate-binding protein